MNVFLTKHRAVSILLGLLAVIHIPVAMSLPLITEIDKLTASDGAANERFGTAVSVDGDTALIGTIRDDDNGTSSCSAYAFVRDGGVWSEQAKVTVQ